MGSISIRLGMDPVEMDDGVLQPNSTGYRKRHIRKIRQVEIRAEVGDSRTPSIDLEISAIQLGFLRNPGGVSSHPG